MAFLRRKTANDHVMGEIYSGFQKSIRRGLIAESLYFGREIASVSTNALHKRICLNILEDISNLDLFFDCYDCSESNFEKMIVKCTQIPKTHISAWLNRVSIQELADSMTVKAESMYELVRNGQELDAAKRGMHLTARGKSLEILDELFPLVRHKCDEKKFKTIFRFCNDSPLLWLVIILWECRPELRQVNISELNTNASATIVVPTIMSELPDWIYDKHTSLGKKLKRGYGHFFEVSLQMNPRVYVGEEPYEAQAKVLYLSNELKSRQVLNQIKPNKVLVEDSSDVQRASKLPRICQGDSIVASNSVKVSTANTGVSNQIKTSTDESVFNMTFTRNLQAQCITGRHKPRVWFSEVQENGALKIVVVKGPDSLDNVNKYVISQKFKELLGLSNPNSRKVYLESNTLYPDSTQGYYLISDLFGVKQDSFSFDKFELRTTSLEQNIRISQNEIVYWSHDDLSDAKLHFSMLKCLAFRKCIGTNDTCLRNILKDGNNIISIDDPALFQKTPYMFKIACRRDIGARYDAVLSDNWLAISTELTRWLKVAQEMLGENKFGNLGVTEEKIRYFIDMADRLSQDTSAWVF